jgi:hypothetical protein
MTVKGETVLFLWSVAHNMKTLMAGKSDECSFYFTLSFPFLFCCFLAVDYTLQDVLLSLHLEEVVTHLGEGMVLVSLLLYPLSTLFIHPSTTWC